MYRCIALLSLIGCTTEPKSESAGSGTGGTTHTTETTGTTDVAPPDDTAPADDTAPGTDSGATTDSGDSGSTTTAPCTLGLQVSLDTEVIASGETLHVGDAPSRAGATVATVTLHNPCEDDLRFLGHPDDWIAGDGFSLQSLPPVYLTPGESADLNVAFSPGDVGAATGTFSLPYDQEGSPFTATLSATATDPLTLVLVGEGGRASTTHDYGATWTTDTWTTLEGHTNAMRRGVCWGDGMFVAVGGSDDAYWWTSPDGDTWTAHVESGGAIGDCDYGDGQFVAFAGDLLTSPDGITWSVSPQAYDPNHLRAMTHGIDATGTHRWVGVGDGGRATVTLDGVSWSFDDTPIIEDVRYIDFGVGSAGPVWVAVGSSGTIATSTDGETWTNQTVASDVEWSGVVFGNDRFLAASGTVLYTSLDGYAWSLVGATNIIPIAHLGEMWIGADSAAAIHLSTDDGLSWTELRAADGGPGYAEAIFAEELVE